MSTLSGKIALVAEVANGHSIAAGCAQAMSDAGAELVLTYVNDTAKPYVDPVAKAVGAKQLLPLDVEVEGQLEAVFDAIKTRWGRLDTLVHSIAFCTAEDPHGRVPDCSRAGFAQAMDISVHSLIRMARLAEPLMTKGGSILTMTYFGGEKGGDHYNVMGPVKAALDAPMRALAVEPGPKQICVNAISPGPLHTRAGSGIAHFDALIDAAHARAFARAFAHAFPGAFPGAFPCAFPCAPEQTLVTIKDVGEVAVMLASDGAHSVSGDTAYVDGGLHVRA